MSETLVGLAELHRKLGKLDADISKKTLRSAVLLASTPAMRAMKLAVPVGSRAHRTHKGNLVSPGFLKRSIKRKTRAGYGWAAVRIGVKAEAYYGVQFVEGGTEKMSAQPWFKRSFVNKRREMEKRLAVQLKRKIEKIARS